jgi:hypothetical protein
MTVYGHHLNAFHRLMRTIRQALCAERREPCRPVVPNCFIPRLELLEDRVVPNAYKVLNLNDSGTGSLRAAVAAANANPGSDVIVFAAGLHGTIALTTGELLISDSVRINGPGANQILVSGNSAGRVFELEAALSVTITGLTITQGLVADGGGGIRNDGSDLNLVADDLTLNVATEGTDYAAAGGALLNLGCTLTVANCQFTGNQALGAAGGDAFGDGTGGAVTTR